MVIKVFIETHARGSEMKQALVKFLRDETGAVTVDEVVVLGGSMWMAMALVTDIGYATMSVTDKINDRLEYATVISEILGEYGPGSDRAGSVEGNNPGNDKEVGNAGESPNGADFGTGENGMSQ